MTSGAVPDAGAPAAPVPPGVDGPAAPPDAPAPEPGEFDDPKPTPAADLATVAAPGDDLAPPGTNVLDVLAEQPPAEVTTPPGAEAGDDPVLAGDEPDREPELQAADAEPQAGEPGPSPRFGPPSLGRWGTTRHPNPSRRRSRQTVSPSRWRARPG